MHHKITEAMQQIDAALFNGDTFDELEDRAELRAYVERWQREIHADDESDDTVREQVRLARLALHADDAERATVLLDELAAKLGLL